MQNFVLHFTKCYLNFWSLISFGIIFLIHGVNLQRVELIIIAICKFNGTNVVEVDYIYIYTSIISILIVNSH